MHRGRIDLGQAKLAGKVPVVGALWQSGAALPCHVFPHIVLACFKQAVRVPALDDQWECFFHVSHSR